MPIAQVNDVELNYRLEGDGDETIVLVNGLADDLETWAYQADDFLAAGSGSCASTTGGRRSSKPAGPYSTGCSRTTRRLSSTRLASRTST